MANAPAPVKDPIARRSDGLISDPWIEYFTAGQLAAEATARRLQTVTLTGQAASIGVTALNTGTLAAGLYRVWWRARVTQPATTSSSLTVTVSTTESGVSLTESGAALTGNTITTVGSGSWVVRVDNASPILYSTTYASVGATVMQYRLDVVLEQVGGT